MLTRLHPPADDTALVVAAQAGDKQAFRELVDRHYKRVYRFLLTHAISATEAEDLTQETFLQAYLNLKSFRGEARCLSWLIGIALNLVRNYTRRSRWRLNETDIDDMPAGFDVAAPSLGATSSNPEQLADYHEALRALEIGLEKLSPDARVSLVMVSLQGLPYEEVATLLGEPVGSIKSRVSRARRQLREHVDPRHLDVLASSSE
jgi:RNA polymerase sigma-70 factor (ECF subfamily)